MITDRLYLMAGSLPHRLNEALPQVATLLESDLDTEREGVHVHIQVGNIKHYSFIEDNSITSYIDRSPVFGDDRFNSPRKVLTNRTYMGDSAWAQTACDYLTSEVEYLIALGSPNAEVYPLHSVPAPTINDIAKSQAESEQGFSLA
jgi:hypothetical protein